MNSLCDSDRDVQDPEENALLDRKDMGILSYKWTFLSLLDFCRCLCLLSNSFPIWESKHSLRGTDVFFCKLQQVPGDKNPSVQDFHALALKAGR